MKADVTAAEALDVTPVVAEDIRIDRPTLHDVVVIRVRDMIIEGTLAAGSRIHEGQLGQQLGISRTPLREALKVLAREGLVDLVQGKGALVSKLTDVKLPWYLVGIGVVMLWAIGIIATLPPALRAATVSPAIATRSV